jgi:hypothetical protein
MSRLHRAARLGKYGEVASCLAQGDDVNAVNARHFSALMLAAREGHLPIVQPLLDAGADASLAHPNGRAALHYAASAGHLDVVRALVAGKAAERSVRKHMAEGLSAEEYAARHGRCILIWSYGAYQYADPEVERWARRVAEVLSTPGLLDECEERFLRGEEREEARRCRARRAESQARRAKRDAKGKA